MLSADVQIEGFWKRLCMCVFLIWAPLSHTTLSQEQQKRQEQQTRRGQKHEKTHTKWTGIDKRSGLEIGRREAYILGVVIESCHLASLQVWKEAHMHACTSTLAVIKLLYQQKPPFILRENNTLFSSLSLKHIKSKSCFYKQQTAWTNPSYSKRLKF